MNPSYEETESTQPIPFPRIQCVNAFVDVRPAIVGCLVHPDETCTSIASTDTQMQSADDQNKAFDALVEKGTFGQL